MGWLNDLTSKWNLKKSFIIYLSMFLIIGIALARVNSALIENFEINNIGKHLKQVVKDGEEFYITVNQNPSASRTHVSRMLLFYKDFAVIIHSIIFSLMGFFTYYIHKIKGPVDYICEIERANFDDIPNGDNELIYACKKVTDEMQFLQEEKIKIWNQYDAFNHMVSSMSHDMKNPLAIIKGNVEILEMIDKEKDDSKIKSETIESIKNNLIRMEKYLERIRYLQSIEQLQIKKEKTSILEFIKGLRHNSELLNSNKYIHWIIPKEDIIICIDCYHIEEAFENILNNAITHANSNVFISIEIKDEKMIISIQDDGKGFSREALKNATNKFYSENPQPGNMGLGLNITNFILEKHAGDLIIRNHNSGALVEMIINL